MFELEHTSILNCLVIQRRKLENLHKNGDQINNKNRFFTHTTTFSPFNKQYWNGDN